MDTSREALMQLLPWYETGRLPELERVAVHDLLAHDLEANRQRREIRALRAALAGEPLLHGQAAAGLERFRAQLDADAAPHRRVAPAWLALAAVLVLALGFGAFFAGESVGRYRTLSSAPVAAAPGMMQESLRVSVAPGVDADTLLAIAQDPNARLVGALSAQGVATLSFPRGHGTQIQARLRADPRLRYVGPATY
jgi:hypothetical protein